ncbi:MAG: GntR family transcriptional regulator [Gemmatimonadota bacterium]|nr:GntR family transcriptional regulator [Gemmatimonadota bacterium]
MLLALTLEREGTAARLLAELGIDAGDVRTRAEAEATRESPGKSPGPAADAALPYTSRAKRALELAMAQARALGNSPVGTEHLVLGLLEEKKGIAARVLHQLGLTLEEARTAARRERTRGASWDFRVAVDDASDRSIYEQIVARIQEGVATGQLRPGDRVPAVRQLADELDVAPGTVARAYTELERLGVVVTDGARGTRIARGERPTMPSSERPAMLVGLLRPVAVAAFHLGATAEELREALAVAMRDILPQGE